MAKEKLNVYQMVTDRIIEELEKGNIPWIKKWGGVNDRAFNRITKKPYSLINQMMLKGGEYATFKQWSELGGKIKRGAKSDIVVFWKMIPIEEEKEDGTKEIKNIPYLRYYNVFHISQVEGVEPLNKDELKEIESIKEVDDIITDYSIRTDLKVNTCITNRAYYSPIADFVEVPCKEQYQKINEYYSTLFHELVHSTGHTKRLNRFENNTKLSSFGSQDYSKEELVAEVGSTTILNSLGIETKDTFKNSVAYIQSWIKVLKNDNKFIVSASSKAEKAVKMILNIA